MLFARGGLDGSEGNALSPRGVVGRFMSGLHGKPGTNDADDAAF